MRPLLPIFLALIALTGCGSSLPTVRVGPASTAVLQELPDLQPRQASQTGIALCLSGGGYRATLFHLGVVWRLNEVGLLPHLDAVSGVSGGAIYAALLGSRWQRLEFVDGIVTRESFEQEIVNPLLALTSATIDTSALIATVNPLVSNPLAKFYDEYLFNGAGLSDLPKPDAGPVIELHATELSLAYSWYFYRDRTGSPSIGFIPDPELSLATIVTASTAVPGVFEPVYLDLDKSLMRFRSAETEVREAISRLQWEVAEEEKAIQTARGSNDVDIEALWAELKTLRERARAELRMPVQLVDGGVIDNLASNACRNSERSIVSDGTITTLVEATEVSDSRFAIGARAVDVMGNIVARNVAMELYRRSLALADHSTCTGEVGDMCVEPFFAYLELSQGMPKDIKELREEDYELNEFSRLPTRLAALTTEQQTALVNWGYVVAESALRRTPQVQVLLSGQRIAPFKLPMIRESAE